MSIICSCSVHDPAYVMVTHWTAMSVKINLNMNVAMLVSMACNMTRLCT